MKVTKVWIRQCLYGLYSPRLIPPESSFSVSRCESKRRGLEVNPPGIGMQTEFQPRATRQMSHIIVSIPIVVLPKVKRVGVEIEQQEPKGGSGKSQRAISLFGLRCDCI